MTDAEKWEQRYVLTEVKYARLYLAVATQASEEFAERLAQAEAERAREALATVEPTPNRNDRQG